MMQNDAKERIFNEYPLDGDWTLHTKYEPHTETDEDSESWKWFWSIGEPNEVRGLGEFHCSITPEIDDILCGPFDSEADAIAAAENFHAQIMDDPGVWEFMQARIKNAINFLALGSGDG